MSNFFKEVDEELRNDRIKAIWKKYGKVIIMAVLVVISLTAGYRYYLFWQEQQAGAAGDQYLRAQELVEEGDREGAKKILDTLAKDGWGGYPMLARLRAATLLLGQGETKEGIEAFDKLSQNDTLTADLRSYAMAQAAMAAIDIEDFDAIVKRTQSLLDQDNVWRHFAREARALAAFKAGNLSEAAKWVAELKGATDVPQGMNLRIEIIEDLIVARGGKIPLSPPS